MFECHCSTTAELFIVSWWRHQMETFSALLALCAGNSPVTGEFPAQRPATRSFDVFFDLRLNKRLSKQSWGWWFETPSSSLWHHRNVYQFPEPDTEHDLHYLNNLVSIFLCHEMQVIWDAVIAMWCHCGVTSGEHILVTSKCMVYTTN